jgi:D-alanyl-D-alanine carboxypeptidase/D-alanyl-D-alanine-endopeptidase (penicillin-binding protein 4)
LGYGAFAFCILHFAFLISCAKAPPAAPASPATPAPPTTTAAQAPPSTAPSTAATAATPTVPDVVPDPLERLRRDILGATQLPGVQRAAWAVVVHSLDLNDRLVDLNARTLLVPASISKIVSVASAAETVGWEFRFDTTLRAAGAIVDGTLRGDLLIVGSGDPTVGGRGGDDIASWIDALKAAGIRRIEGRVIGDDDAIEDPRPQLAWAWDDLGYATGGLFGALNLGENRMAVTISPGAAAGAPARVAVEPHAAYRPLANRIVTTAPGTTQLLWPEQRPGEPFLTVAGTIPAGASPARLTVAVGNPTFWFASVLRHRLLREGIEVTGEAWDIDDVVPPIDRASNTVLFTHRSPPLAAIAQPLLKESINLYGEAVMRLNAVGTIPATNDAALAGLKKRLDAWGVAPDSQQIIDGSGLSRRNTIAAETLLIALQRMHDRTNQSPFMTALPVAGVDGTLEGRMRGTPAAGNVRAKTGTMSNIRSLAGYVTTRDGERLAFVVMANNFEGTGAAANQALDAIAVKLAEFSRNP